MPTEIEAKFLDVSHEELRTRLRSLGANCTHPNRLTKRLTIDYPDQRLRKSKNGWVRLRDEGDKITLTYKQLNDRTLSGMGEVEVVVDDFKKTEAFLRTIGLVPYNYQETKRESWVLDGVEIDLDEWPWIAPFVEIEGPSEEAVWHVVQQLGLIKDEALFGSVEIAYVAEYDISEEEVDNWERITFTPIPDWLRAKAKKQ
jgi:adenylate cyclase class 2